MTKVAFQTSEERLTNFINDVGKFCEPSGKNKVRFLSHAIYRNKFQMDYRSKCKTENSKILEENVDCVFSIWGTGKIFQIKTWNSEAMKEKIESFFYVKV